MATKSGQMVRKTGINGKVMTHSHPYKEYEDSKLWAVIEKALEDLVENQDLNLCTRKEYIIGFLIKSLVASELIDSEVK